MATLSELIKEKRSLPAGNIYQKTINGKTYNYYQYFENGKRYTKIVDEETCISLRKGIARRKEIESIVKEYRQKEKLVTLSKKTLSLTGELMCGNVPVAKFENGDLVEINKKLAPYAVIRTSRLELFLKLRTIDMSRTNARILKRALGISTDEETTIPLYSYAMCVSDNYWFKPKHSKVKYQDIIFKDDSLFDLSLKGNSLYFSSKPKLTPELTTIGSFEKGWKIIDGEWWLYKKGNEKQIFSELFCYHFAKLIGLPTAKYEYDEGYIRSKNFADKYNFEPMAALFGEDDKYESLLPFLYQFNRKVASEYLYLSVFDAVVYNVDRHNENTGILRDRNTGEIVSLAPNFDNNLALISTIDMLNLPKQDGLIKVFIKFVKSCPEAILLYQDLVFKDIAISDLQSIIDKIPIKIEDSDRLIDVIYQRYNYLKNIFNKQHY